MLQLGNNDVLLLHTSLTIFSMVNGGFMRVSQTRYMNSIALRDFISAVRMSRLAL